MKEIRRLAQCHVPNSWVLEADRIKRVLSNDLSVYESIIDPENYKHYKQKQLNTKKPAWYSKNTTLEACIYILSAANIAAGNDDLKKKFREAELAGQPFSEAQKKAHQEAMMKECMVEWSTKVTKIAPILNPAFGNFLKVCTDLYNYLEKEREKEKEKDKSDSKGKGQVQCGLDRCRLFTGCTLPLADLRCKLLEAHCKKELRRQFFHPVGFSDPEVK